MLESVSVRDWVGRGVDTVSFALGRAVPVAVFMFHSVHPDASRDFGPWRYAITPDRFERQVRAIADSYDVRPLSDIVAACRRGTPPTEPTAAITFDDGFRDNLTEALPILERHETPATVFVAGTYLDGPAPYEYRLAAKLSSATSVAVTVGDTRVETELHTEGDRREAYEAIRRELKFERSEVREATLAAVPGDAADVPAMLTSAELRELAASPLVEIGAHGYEHVPMTVFDEAALARDVSRARSALESHLDGSVTLFSYPYGDHDERVVEAVRGVGFAAATTTRSRRLPATDLAAERFRLPRLDGTE